MSDRHSGFRGETLLLRDGREPVGFVPELPEPVYVQSALRICRVEYRNNILADGTKRYYLELALDFRVFLTKDKKFLKFGRAIAHSVKFAECLVGRDAPV